MSEQYSASTQYGVEIWEWPFHPTHYWGEQI